MYERFGDTKSDPDFRVALGVRLKLSLASAAKNVAQLVADELLDVGAGGLEILARVKLVGMFIEEGAHGAGHGKAQVGVDVDLADGELCGLAQLILGHADSVGHLAAVLVDHLDILLRDGGGAVQHDGEAGQSLGDFLQHVEAQRGRNEDALLVYGALLGLELESAVARADGLKVLKKTAISCAHLWKMMQGLRGLS